MTLYHQLLFNAGLVEGSKKNCKAFVLVEIVLFSQKCDRKKVVRSVLRIHTPRSVKLSISERPLLEIIFHFWQNVLLVHSDEAVTVMPHWC